MIYKLLIRPEDAAPLSAKPARNRIAHTELLFIILLVLWFLVPWLLEKLDPTVATIDQSHWLLVLLGIITFMLVLAICWWLMQQFWKKAGLPNFNGLFLQFYHLTSWQQLKLVLALFALLLSAATVCIAGIC